jgi:hypothetical protein
VGSVGLLLPTAMTSADLGCDGFAERSISRCEPHLGLRDRLKYAGSLDAPNVHTCRAAGARPSGDALDDPGPPAVLAAVPGQPHQPSWMYHLREAQGKHPGPRSHGRGQRWSREA